VSSYVGDSDEPAEKRAASLQEKRAYARSKGGTKMMFRDALLRDIESLKERMEDALQDLEKLEDRISDDTLWSDRNITTKREERRNA